MPPEFRLNVLVRTLRYCPPLSATMTFSMASRQFAAFHQPVVSYRPLPLYHCCRISAAASVFALKSSPASGKPAEPPLTAKTTALPPLLPLCHDRVTLVIALDEFDTGKSAA